VPVIFVEGVVNGTPVADGFERRYLFFVLMPWRFRDRDERPELPMRVDIPVTPSEERLWLPRLEEHATIELSVGALSVHEKARVLARGRLPFRRVEGSAELRAALAAYRRPVIIRDAELGKLVLDRRHNWFTTRLELHGRRCTLAITRRGVPDDPARDQRDVTRARRVVARLRERWRVVEERIVRSMLPLYNDVWRERRRVITAAQLLARARPELVVIHADGRTSVSFSDGGLFEDNAILVRLNPAGGVSECHVANPEALTAA
jgi:hypothetical protein